VFFYIPNVASQSAKKIERPWEVALPAYPAEISAGPKDKFREWCALPTTSHYFLSMFEGIAPESRISDEDKGTARDGNAPQYCHGVIVDYDSDSFAGLEVELAIIKRKPAHPVHRPQWLVTTFSNKYRLVWTFERPVVIGDYRLAREFQKIVRAEIKAKNWLKGMDEVIRRPGQYYEIGRKWTDTGIGKPIDSGYVWAWASRAARNLVLAKSETPMQIPMDAIAAAVQEKFPGRWRGDFALDAYGVRFWDPSADHPSGCQVRAWGMQVYSRGPHMSWEDIFGKEFVEKYVADRLGPVMENTFWDGRDFWYWNEYTNSYVKASATDFAQRLRVRGFSQLKSKGATMSEIDRVEDELKNRKLVAAALPFVHKPAGLIRFQSDFILNTNTRKCMAPAEPGSVRDILHGRNERFPWVYRFLQGFFSPTEQLQYFLAWLKWFYEHGLAEEPKQGHMLVIAGPAGKGKTFMSTQLIGRMVGGCADATQFLVENSKFSATVAREPLMSVDDASISMSNTEHERYSNNVKRLVANRTLVFEQKYQQAGQVEWLGRVIVTCNTSPRSLRVVPSIEHDNLDKLMLFRCSDDDTIGPGGTGLFSRKPEEIEAILSQELPYFCRWLLDWEIPSALINRHNYRFGVVPYYHRDLYEVALQQGRSYGLLEALMEFLSSKTTDPETKELTEWSGSAMQLHREMNTHSAGSNEYLRRLDSLQLGTCLAQLQQRGYNITRKVVRGLTVWTVPYSLHIANADLAKSPQVGIFDDVREINPGDTTKDRDNA